jgi:hypothetical protein
MQKFANTGEIVDMKDLMLGFNANVSASVVFGLHVDCLADPNAEFKRVGLSVSLLFLSLFSN